MMEEIGKSLCFRSER